ncbi:MAG TPA: tetratricopeptide repeat protein, partial [Pyrinomonadaceae bacterium]|nr:tetratricopeptide repeat protein [Pyrinomonadaceae bacterium]
MADELIKLDTRKPAVKVLMIVTLVFALVWSWFVVRWYIGNTMAEYLNPEEHSLAMAGRAISLAPNDPLTHWRLGEFTQKQLPPEHLAQAISEYETAVSLAPNDYRLWLSLGTAREGHGDVEKAEKALRRSVELAPSYSYPAWYLGNLLLRRGRYEEAFAELRRASENDSELRPQLFNLAWEVYSTDFESLKSVIGPNGKAHFSQYLLERDRFDDGLRMWYSLNETEKR